MIIDFQTRMVFPTHAVPPSRALPVGVEAWTLPTPDGARLVGTHWPPEDGRPSNVLVIGFGGNAWNGQEVGSYLHELYCDVHVVAFHYRGYRPSTGTPSAKALIADASLIYDLAVERLQPRRIVAAGFSIGSGIAANLSKARKLDGLILVTPFDSLRAVAQSFYPWLPIAGLFAHEIDAAGALDCNEVPVAIVAGDRDEIIAVERTDALRKRVRRLVFDRTIAHAGHNDIYARSDFQSEMRSALTAVLD